MSYLTFLPLFRILYRSSVSCIAYKHFWHSKHREGLWDRLPAWEGTWLGRRRWLCHYNVLCRHTEIDFADGKTQCILLHFPIIQSSLSFTDDSVAKYFILCSFCSFCVQTRAARWLRARATSTWCPGSTPSTWPPTTSTPSSTDTSSTPTTFPGDNSFVFVLVNI